MTSLFFKSLKIIVTICFVLTFTTAGYSQEKTNPVTLTSDGTTQHVITLGVNASASEKFAAEELSRYLKQISGADFQILPPEKAVGKLRIAVGPEAAKSISPNLSLEGLGADGIVIKADEPPVQNIILTGGIDAPRGTLYAVYTFLEDYLGVRWWTPEWTQIPMAPTIQLEPAAIRFVPKLEYREPFYYSVLKQPQWAAANKANGHHYNLQNDAQRGGAIGYTPGLQFVHTFYVLAPMDKYYDKHPDWFSEIGGVRVKPDQHTQLCLTNKELLAHVIEEAKKYLRQSPPDTMISISQNDVTGEARCQCAQCMALENREGSPAGPLLHFVNAVADAIRDEFPHAAVDTIAYQYTRHAPKYVRPRPNVIVRLCSIECDLGHRVDDEKYNSLFAKDLKEWTAISPRTYVWTYEQNFLQYLMPYPNIRMSGENIKTFIRHGIKGIFAQGSYQGPSSDLQELRAWLSAKLMWNPDQDTDKLIHLFVDAYYGPASPAIYEYINRLQKSVEKTGARLLTNDTRPDPAYLTLESLLPIDRAFAAIPAETFQDPVYGPRIRTARAWLQYAILNSLPEIRVAMGRDGITAWPFSQTPEMMMAEFQKTCEENKGTLLSENGRTPDQFVLRSMDTTPVTPLARTIPSICKGKNEKLWQQFTQDYFYIYKDGWTQIDTKAETGLAAATTGDHNNWTIQCYYLSQPAVENPSQKWDVYVSARVIRKGQSEGVAFVSGLYENMKRIRVGDDYHAKISETSADNYSYVKIASDVRLTPSTFWWLSPANNGENVESVMIDRLILIKK